jgi:hypothetical protein
LLVVGPAPSRQQAKPSENGYSTFLKSATRLINAAACFLSYLVNILNQFKSIYVDVLRKHGRKVSSIPLSILRHESIVDIDIGTSKVSSIVSTSISIFVIHNAASFLFSRKRLQNSIFVSFRSYNFSRRDLHQNATWFGEVVYIRTAFYPFCRVSWKSPFRWRELLYLRDGDPKTEG